MKKILPAIMSLLITANATAQETVKLSMKDCMEYALKHNYTIRNASLDVLIQNLQNNQTLAAAYPHINGKAEVDDFINPQKSFIDASTFATPGSPGVPAGTIVPISFTVPYASSANISASQLLFDGAVFVAYKARNTVLELARQSGKVSEENLRYNVYKAYNSLVIGYRQYSIVRQSLGYARSLERDLEITRQNGFAEKIDVERTSVQVNNLATDSIRIGNMLIIAEQVLKYQMGMDINNNIVLTDTAIDESGRPSLSLLSEQEQYDRVPEYNVMTTSLKLNEFNLKRYQLNGIPSVNVFGAAGYNYGSNKFADMFLFNKYAFNSTVGVQLNVAIFNGWMRVNQVREAKLNIEKSKNNIESIKQTIDFQAAQGRTNLKNALLQVQSQHRNLDLSSDVLDLAQRKYKAGVGSNLEVNQAQTDLLRSQTNYFSALLEVINAEADLKKALGLLK